MTALPCQQKPHWMANGALSLIPFWGVSAHTGFFRGPQEGRMGRRASSQARGKDPSYFAGGQSRRRNTQRSSLEAASSSA